MNPAERSLRAVFCEAAEIDDPAARSAFLDDACGGDDGFRARLQQLLAADSNAGGFLRDAQNRPELATARIGERIGRYRIVERLGQGGYGVVYRAEQEEPVRREVALKIIKLGMDTGAVVARFELERQALALMDHPNIARVLDAGATETGRPFFVMELVRGLPITKYCQQYSLSVRQRIELFIRVCQAVQHAHQKGIIHRDLKPSNILVAEQDGVPMPKVIDFGIAKATEVVGSEGMTSAQEFIGTPAYMSPEQVTSGVRDIDTRSDIYGLGVILYELMTGHPPFEAKALAQAGIEEMRRLIREVDPPRPSTSITRNLKHLPHNASVTFREQLSALRGDLDWIVMKCLEKDRTRRYETANALAMDLRLHLEHEPVVARPPSGVYRLQKIVRRHRLWFVAGATVGLILIVAAFVSIRQAYRATRAEHEQSRLRGIAESKASESQERLIRRYVAEGNRLVESRRPLAALPWLVEALQLEQGDTLRASHERLRIAQALDDAPKLQLHFDQGDWVDAIAFSPDGKRLAAGCGDHVVRISTLASGGAVFTNLSLPSDVRAVDFSPDGIRVAAADRDGWVRLWKAETGEALTPLMRAADFDEDSVKRQASRLYPTARFSPDGKWLLVAWGSKSAQLRDAFTGELRREFPHGALVWHAAFSKDGALVVTSGDDGKARVWETDSGAATGVPMRQNGFVGWSGFSADGKRMLTVRDRHMVQIWEWRTGTRVGPEITSPKVLFHASLSPDGKTFLTATWSGLARLHETGTGRIQKEFHHEGCLLDAAFSPDGRHIAVACEDGNTWLWQANDSQMPAAVLPLGDAVNRVAFSEDGKFLGTAGRSGRARVWELFSARSHLHRFATSDGQWVEFDPSAQRIVVAGGSQDGDVRLYDVTTGKRLARATVAGATVRHARFSPDGAQVLLTAGDAAQVIDAGGRTVLPPLRHRGAVTDALWSPDGKWIVTAGKEGVQLWNAGTGESSGPFAESDGVVALALSGDGKTIATAHTNRTVRLWSLSSRQCILAPWFVRAPVGKLAFAPDGRHVAYSVVPANTDSEVQVRDLTTGGLVTSVTHRNELTDFEYSRDGRRIVTTSEDRTARVWDAGTGEAISPWLIHPYEIQAAHLAPDGERLVTLGTRGFVRLWNASTGEPLTSSFDFTRDNGRYLAQFSPGGERLLFTTGARSAWILDLQPEQASLDELKLRAMALSCMRLDPSGGVAPLDNATLLNAWQELRSKTHGR